MPHKKDPDKTHGQKLIGLIAHLMFSQRSYSLTELAEYLNCSKATVLRLIDDITLSYAIPVETEIKGNKKYFSVDILKRKGSYAALTPMELSVLQMCKAFAEHLLGRQQVEEAANALLKSQQFLQKSQVMPIHSFSSFKQGGIDYTPHQDTIKKLIEAMESRKVCKVKYRKIMGNRDKEFRIMPLKLFSHADTIYLHARLDIRRNKNESDSIFDPLLAVQRIRKVIITELTYTYPKDYDFESIFNKHFGIIKDDPFLVQIEFSGWAASYVAERIFSPDQKLTKKRNGNVHLKFTATSEPELFRWVLSFGPEAKVLKPDWLVDQIKDALKSMKNNYPAKGL